MRKIIASIVEGDGDVPSVRVLLQRIAALEFPNEYFDFARPMRVPRSKLVQTGEHVQTRELERYVGIAGKQQGGVFILIDADTDCLKDLGLKLLARARDVRSDLPIAVVLAKFEYEAWFLAVAESLRGKRDLPSDFSRPDDAEAIRGAKEYLSKRMGRKYEEPVDQPALTAQFDFHEARQYSRSFRKCYKEVTRLLNEIQGKESP